MAAGAREFVIALQRKSIALYDRGPALFAQRCALLRPERAILKRGRQQQLALAAEAAIELGLRKQGAHFRLAAGGEQRQPVERAGQRAGLDKIGAALAEPAGQLQARIVIGSREAEAVGATPFEVSKATIASE